MSKKEQAKELFIEYVVSLSEENELEQSYLEGKMEAIFGKEAFNVFQQNVESELSAYGCNVNQEIHDLASIARCIGVLETVGLSVIDGMVA